MTSITNSQKKRLNSGRYEAEQQDRGEHRQHAPQLRRQNEVESEGAKDRVEGPEIPFGHDLRRRRQRVGRDVIVRVPEVVRRKERDDRVDEQEGGGEPAVLRRVERVERQRIALVL